MGKEAMAGPIPAEGIGQPAERAPVGPDGRTSERSCLNCGCALVGDYCHCCGQHVYVHRTLGAWWHDFLHSVLHVDGKFLRTIPMLAWRPGELTRRYALGERAKFISPLALFLFTIFLMFAVFSLTAPGLDLGLNRNIEQGITEERQRLQRLEGERRGATDPAEQARLDERIASTREDVERLEQLKANGVKSAVFGADGGQKGDALFNRAYEKATSNPELLVYKVQANAYKFSWALIPISVPFVWVLFLHRKRYRRDHTAYDHLVFVTYSIAFMSMALVGFVLLAEIGLSGDLLGTAFLVLPPVHIYRQLRGAYRLSRLSALWRAAVLVLFAVVALTLFAMLLLALGVSA